MHGCADELIELLGKSGYAVHLEGTGDARHTITTAPKGRRAFFVGDLVDRGPNSPDVLRIVMDMVERGQAFSVIGNHDESSCAGSRDAKSSSTNGLERTVAQYRGSGRRDAGARVAFLDTLPSHAWVDDGRLAVAHAGVREGMLGRDSPGCATSACTATAPGRPAADGLPERFNFGADYRGKTAVVYGHTPVAEPEWLNNTMCIDTGCVFGGKLTALRWPERELVSVPAREAYAVLRRGVRPPARAPAARPSDALIVPRWRPHIDPL